MNSLISKSIDRYHILEQLGEGGMAIVYKAYDTRLERDVAVKVIRTEKLTLETMGKTLKRFEREAKALAKLTHPNIVPITDYGEHDGKPYLVMPHLPGGTLKQVLKGKPMPWEDAIPLLIPIARALHYAHQQGIIHRDVKPSNILITQSGEPMLTDFGIAKILIDTDETADLTGTGMGVGTPEYMSPEQFQGKGVDARADIYSLGVVLYEMITGRTPYQADTPAAVLIKQATDPLPRPKGFIPDLPDSVERILLKALSKKVGDRYQTMGEVASILEGLSKQSGPDNTMGVLHQAEAPFTYKKSLPSSRLSIFKLTNTWRGWLPIALLVFVIGISVPLIGKYLGMDTGEVEKETIIPASIITTSSSSGNTPSTGETQINPSYRTVHAVVVDANNKWNETGVLVREGDIVEIIHLSGEWRSSSDYSWVDGTDCKNACSDCLLTTASEGSLVAKVGNGKVYCATTSSYTSATTGILLLSFNDCSSMSSCFSDNEGSLDVQVVITSNHGGIEANQDGAFQIMEDFEDGEIKMLGFSADSDRWKIVDDGTGNKVFQVDNRNGTGTPGFSFGAEEWKDYITEYRIKYLNDNYIGLQVRTNGLHSYIVNMGIGDLYLAYSTPEEWTRLTTKTPPIRTGIWHEIRVVVDGNIINVSIDGNQWISENDSKYRQGWLLMFAEAGAYAQIDDIQILEIK